LLQDIKNTVKQSAIYGLSRVSFKLIAFVLFPFYSTYFSVADYGVIVRGEIFWQLLQTFMLYAIETAVMRWYSLIAEPDRKKALVFSVFSFLLFVNMLLLVISFIFPSQISTLLFDSNQYGDIVKYSVLIAMFETLLGIPLLMFRIREKAFVYVILVVSESILSLGLQLYLITSTNQKLAGVFTAKAIASLLILLTTLPALIRYIKFRIDLPLLRDILKFCAPLMLASLVSTLFVNQDRFILGYLADSSQVGLYGLGNNIAGILTFVFIAPFALAFPPIFWRKINDNNAARFYTKSMTYSFVVFAYSALALSLISPNFIKVFARNPDYWLAMNVVPFASFSLVFYGMQVVGFMSFYQSKKTSIVLLILVISCLLNILLNLALVPYLQMYGAAVAKLAAFLVSSILIYLFSKRYYFIKWENYKMSVALLTGILITIPFYLLDFGSLWLSATLKVLGLLLFPFILYLFRFYEDIEIATVKRFARRILRL